MPNETINENEAPKTPVFSIVCNNIEVPIFEHKVAKGPNVGDIFYAPDLETLTLDEFISFFPKEELMENFIKPNLKRSCVSISKEAQGASGNDSEVLKQEYGKLFAGMSARQQTIGALKEALAERLAELAKFGKLMSDPSKAGEVMPKFLECAKKVANLEQAIAEKRDKKEDAPSVDAASTPTAQAA